MEFIKELEQLPNEVQNKINAGLQHQIIEQAEFIKREMPDRYLSYLDEEIGKAEASMLRMVNESNNDGAILPTISEIYIWNKERKKTLCRLKDAFIKEHGKAFYEPQQKDLHYYCQKAIEKGYLVKVDGGYRRVSWSKAQLAYFLGHFKKIDGTFPDIEYCNMFGESRLSKALGQLINNKTGYGKPKGYEIVDNILQE